MSVLDIAHPIMDNGRDEILLVTFDGFIKNTSEGIVRTMCRDEDDWIEKYPNLKSFSHINHDVLYENTMIFTPMDLMYMLSDGKLSDEELLKDMSHVLPSIFLENSKITSFEFALYNMMKKPFIKRVVLYREIPFFDNEFQYVEREFNEVIDKIEWVCGGILSAIDEIKPTTLFTSDYEFVKIMSDLNQAEWEDMMVFLLNTNRNMFYHESENQLLYTDEFLERMHYINAKSVFGIAPMYNQLLESDNEGDEEDNTEGIEENEKESEDNEE